MDIWANPYQGRIGGHTPRHINSHEDGEGQLAPLFAPLADALRRDSYDGVISFESVYHPGNGNFEDGFRQSIGLFKDLFGDN